MKEKTIVKFLVDKFDHIFLMPGRFIIENSHHVAKAGFNGYYLLALFILSAGS
jgi:hypothetical protein